MSKLNRFRQVSRIVGIITGIAALMGVCARNMPLAVAGMTALAADILAIAVKTRCPFCHKPLRLTPPVGSEEFCPYCGGKIE